MDQFKAKPNQTEAKNIVETMVLFYQYWALSDMVDIKKHVLKLGNSMVTLKNILAPPKPNQTEPKQKILKSMVAYKFQAC